MPPTPTGDTVNIVAVPDSDHYHSSQFNCQYEDGKAAKIWKLYIGDESGRASNYKNFLVRLLKEKNVKNVLDSACGTGVDSVMLLEEGFNVTSCDASDKMLKTAHVTRWERRKDGPTFDSWVIQEANWLTLEDEVEKPEGSEGFDAVICMGNSFPHLLDDYGDFRDHKVCFRHFAAMVKPGGIFIIDHRNYDYIIEHGHAPKKNIYYNSKHIQSIKTCIVWEDNKPNKVTLKYTMDVEEDDFNKKVSEADKGFVLEYYPHTLANFTKLLKHAFGERAKHTIYGDFKPVDEVDDPAFYIHVIEKPLSHYPGRYSQM